MSGLSGAVRWLAGPVGRVGLDIEGVTGGGLQVPDDVLQSCLTDGLLVFLFHGVWGPEAGEQQENMRNKKTNRKARTNEERVQ